MQRIRSTPRPAWQKIVESQGFHFHTLEEQPYWDESVYYQFTRTEIDELEKATCALDEMCLQAVQYVIEQDLFEKFQIPPRFVPWVRQSWEEDELTIYGRFDLAYDGKSPPKLLEYNADTPTSLLEAAVVQWYWFKDVLPRLDQFNSIHERLIEAWQTVPSFLPGPIHFTCLRGNLEDYMTVSYLRDTAMQAGLETHYLDLEMVGWNYDRQIFVDEREQPIRNCFKLYPWEWMVKEAFAPHLLTSSTRWLEAPWKMLLSNKAILPVLYSLFPNSPYLLEASFEPLAGSFIRKPIFGREGANMQVVQEGEFQFETPGIYAGPYVYQSLCTLPVFDGICPVIGSWIVNGNACGIGVREDLHPVTQNTSRFVPHVFGP